MLVACGAGGAGMGFSPCLACKQDLGEAPSKARVPRPAGGSMQVLQHAHVPCTTHMWQRAKRSCLALVEANKAPT